jgi:Flp pilus assembly protein TadG
MQYAMGTSPATGPHRPRRLLPTRLVRAEHEDSERGAVAVLVAILLVVLCIAAAFAIDLGHVSKTYRQAQTAVDDAALSAAASLQQNQNLDSAVTVAEQYVQENFPATTNANWDGCADPPSGYSAPAGISPGENCVSFNAAGTAVNVALPPQFVSFTVARAAGLVGTTVQPMATATTHGGGSAPCALCLLDPTGNSLLVQKGQASINITGPEGIMDDSSDSAAITTQKGQASIAAPVINVTGGADGGNLTCTTAGVACPTTGVPPIPDPLGFLPAVTPTSGAVQNVSGGGTISPGNYESISFNGSNTLTLNPGTYVVTGGISLGGTGTIQGTGVTLYLTCGDSSGNPVSCSQPHSTAATITMQGTPNIDLTAPTTGPYAGLTIFMDRSNTSTIQLHGDPTLTGTIYAKSGGLDLEGNSSTLASLIVVGTASVSDGKSNISINYEPITDPNQNVFVPSSTYLCSRSAANC